MVSGYLFLQNAHSEHGAARPHRADIELSEGLGLGLELFRGGTYYYSITGDHIK